VSDCAFPGCDWLSSGWAISSASFEHAASAREALRLIVADPALGPGVLENPSLMANLLQDLLPGAPREAGILAAAAQKDVAGRLRDHVERGLDAATSVRLAAALLASSTAFTPEVCQWVALEFAVAMGVFPAGVAVSALPEAGANAAGSATAAARPETAGPAVTQPGTSDRASGGSILAAPPDASTVQPTADGRATGLGTQSVAGPAVPASVAATGASGNVQAGMPGYGRAARPRRRRPLAALIVVICVVVVVAVAGVIGYRLAGSPHLGSADQPSSSSSPGTPAPSGSASPTASAPPAAPPGIGWIAQLASVNQSAGTAELGQLLARIRVSVPQATVLDSSGYASLRPGFWVIYYRGNFASGAQALTFCASHGFTTARQCIGRYLSHSPADFGYQCYPPAGSPSGNCSHSRDPASS
jgi:hypothetical protein